MNAPQELSGFVTEARAYLRDLSVHNSRDWFQANKGRYDAVIKRPALTIMDALSPALQDWSDAPVKAKLFRPHRDMRFSEDKTPYHTHLHLLWSCADGRGWFFGLAQDYATAGAGIMAFDAETLESYKEQVAQEAGRDLADLLEAIGGRMDAPALKRVPAPFAADHPRGDLLRRKGLVVWRDDLDTALEADGVAALEAAFATLRPLQDWLAEL